MVEIRLDLLAAEGLRVERALWRHLAGVPLLFTARREDEGGGLEASATQRAEWLAAAIDDAACIDVEIASAGDMRELLAQAAARGIPWVASYHDFGKLPAISELAALIPRAGGLGAGALKVAARLNARADLLRLAEFQDHATADLPLATMGMGPLAPVSRLLCAQAGSVLNYGYLGEAPTAPGQWDAALLKQAMAGLVPYSG